FGIATAPRPGPVHLTFPMDVQRAEVLKWDRPPGLSGRGQGTSRGPGGPPHQPLLIAGSGVFYAAQSGALARLCERCAVPAVVPVWDRGSIDRPIPQFMGVIGAASGGPRLLPDADLILLCGAAVDYRLGYLKPPAIRPDAQIVAMEPEQLDSLEF